jgi:anaerobic dimethyl sulfoxide reductase subunit B (iron-sulfur subunit)
MGRGEAEGTMNGALFVMDMASCVGCYACSVACKDRAGLPDALDLLRVEEHEGGAYPEPTLYYRVVHCFHCESPPCAEACPTQALAKSEGGLVVMDAGKCTGCGDCISACPYDAIVMLPEGVVAKCDGCPDEVAKGWQPTCIRACPMRALGYGPANDTLPENRVQDASSKNFGIGPAVLYLCRPG